MTQTQPEQRKAMVFDVDKSLSTLGPAERQERIFGVPPVSVVGGINEINNYLDQLLTVVRKQVEHPLLGPTGEEITIQFNEKGQEIGVNTLMVDSLSVLGMQERSQLMKADGLAVMERRTWGIYGDKMIKFINKLSKCEFGVVCTSHVSRKEDENGAPIDIPALKGASKEECGRFFDVIAYCHVSKDAQGRASEYSWIVNSDRRHIYAKNRGGILGPTSIPQDLSLIFETYARHGKYDPKILIIGDTGQGKTWSLQTLNSTEPSEELLQRNAQEHANS